MFSICHSIEFILIKKLIKKKKDLIHSAIFIDHKVFMSLQLLALLATQLVIATDAHGWFETPQPIDYTGGAIAKSAGICGDSTAAAWGQGLSTPKFSVLYAGGKPATIQFSNSGVRTF